MYDLIIKNGTILDGTGAPGYCADVAIKDGKIAAIGVQLQGGKQVIDATGLTVTPGFIDSHSHADNAILKWPEQREKLEQGITTNIAGQCGGSIAPISRDAAPSEFSEIRKTMGTFLDHFASIPQGSNIALLVGHGTLRSAVMGEEGRAPTAEELERMLALLRDAMEHGALGISFGLAYSPGCFADTEELIAFAKVVGEYGGVASIHQRDEGDNLVKNAQEFIKVLEAAGIRGIHSHLKASRKVNWGKVNDVLRLMEEANARGVELYCDVYPYIAWHTSAVATFLPKEYRDGGKPAILANLQDEKIRAEIKAKNIEKRGDAPLDWVMISRCKNLPQYEGLRLPEIAAIHGKDAYETLFDLIVQSDNVCKVCGFVMCDEDVETVMAHPLSMICTDATVAKNDNIYHPRLRGSFPRVLGRYVRERKITSLPEMIRKMTSLPAEVYSLKGKGILKEGYDADICIFDAEKIIDRAEFIQCHARAEGLNYVLVGGEVVVEDAVHNGKCMGKVLLHRADGSTT